MNGVTLNKQQGVNGEHLDIAIQAAIGAGRTILEVYEGEFSVSHKADETPVTEADMLAHHHIHSLLERLTPELPVLTEESAAIDFAERARWHRYWLVDPLDGTREFIHRSGEFTVNVALIEGHRPVLGVIYAPVLGIYYYAARGLGAYKREAMEPHQRIRTRRFQRGQAVVACSRFPRSKAMERFLHNLGDPAVITVGSALKSCLVAEGKADIYPRLGPTSEWDTAAAQCIVEEAGGQITDTRMQPLRYNTKSALLNPHFFAFGDPSVDWSRYLGAS